MEAFSPLTIVVKGPVVPLTDTFATPGPPTTGLALVAVAAKTTPRSVIAAAPSIVTFPPSLALVAVMPVFVGVITVGVVRPLPLRPI